MNHGLEGAQCEYNINNETMKQIKLIMRYAKIMQGKYQTWKCQCKKRTMGESEWDESQAMTRMIAKQ